MKNGARPANTSPEEQAMREVVDAWGRARWGADVRVLHELAMGDRRIDMVFVLPADLVGVEIKGPKDGFTKERIGPQIREFRFFLPEVWLVVAPKWESHPLWRSSMGVNKAVVVDGQVSEQPARERRDALRDDLCCSRLLELLWTSEAHRLARRHGVPDEYAPGRAFPVGRLKSTIARMLTGHQIVKGVCAELRARTLTGMASDEPLNQVVSARPPP